MWICFDAVLGRMWGVIGWEAGDGVGRGKSPPCLLRGSHEFWSRGMERRHTKRKRLCSNRVFSGCQVGMAWFGGKWCERVTVMIAKGFIWYKYNMTKYFIEHVVKSDSNSWLLPSNDWPSTKDIKFKPSSLSVDQILSRAWEKFGQHSLAWMFKHYMYVSIVILPCSA